MKRFLVTVLIFATAFTVQAQLNPISWTFTAKKIADKTFEIQMKATIQNKWHLYSQAQPADAIAIPKADYLKTVETIRQHIHGHGRAKRKAVTECALCSLQVVARNNPVRRKSLVNFTRNDPIKLFCFPFRKASYH